jgi:acetyltransferase-like isoleucine patch superfamily enzyme
MSMWCPPGFIRLNTWFVRRWMRFDYLGKDVRIWPSCDIRRAIAPYIHIGNRVSISHDVWLNVPCPPSCPIKGKPIISIGDGTAIGRRCSISGNGYIEIGANVLFGPNVLVMDHAHEFQNPHEPIMWQGITEPGKIIIEEGCWLGYNSCILTHRNRTIRIGRNTVVGANAVVTKSFPSNSVLVGAPARNVKE